MDVARDPRGGRGLRRADARVPGLTPPSPRRPLAGELALAGAALIYGSTFVVVQRGTEDLTPAAFLAVRFTVGAAALLPFLRRRTGPGRSGPGQSGPGHSGPGAMTGAALVRAGVAAGAALLVGYALQTVGLQYTTTSTSAFLTGLFVVFTPVLAAAVLRRPPTPVTVAAVALATAGLFLLTGADVGTSAGEVLTVGCAVAFAVHILVVAETAGRFDPARLNAVQLAVVAAGSLAATPLVGVGRVTAGALTAAALTGVLASAVAFTLQLHGQRRLGPIRSALLLSLEPVFAGVFGFAAGERLGPGGFAGAALILAAVLLAEVAPRPGRGPVTTS